MRVSTWAAATLVWILLASGACLAHLIAQTGAPSAEPAAADKAGKELHALRISANAASIRLDGRIDDEGWMRAQVISDLTQEDPDNMMAPTDSMTVRVAYDDRYIYVAVQMAMRDVSELRDGFGRRGSAPPSDRVFIAFDTAHDHQNAYVFEVNASGVQNDYLDVGDTGTNNDYEAVCGKSRHCRRDRDGTPSSESLFRKCVFPRRGTTRPCGASTSAATCLRAANRIGGSPDRAALKASSRGSAILFSMIA
jgi:hypothetical protein